MPKLRSLAVYLLLSCAAMAVAQNPSGALDGREIVLSPGHGYYWHSTLGWTTQRGLIDGLIEDIHTHEIVHDHVLPWLENSGARVVMCRARSRTLEEHIIQNDAGAPAYTETGSWITSSSSGFAGTTYRYASMNPVETATAIFSTTITRADNYPIYVAWRAGSNRATTIDVRIEHAGGTSLRTINQSRYDRRWVYVGTFPFSALQSARVTLSNRGSSTSEVVIADAVKIGDGLGSISRGAGVSGHPRWLEASRYHAQHFGAPASVYDTAGEDNGDDVTCRPRYGEWFTEGQGDLFLSLHTNAGGGTGTSSFIYSNGATPGSSAWQTALHTRLVNAIRSQWDPSWTDRGQRTANFGELRVLNTMPGCLVELAFHDDIGGDIEDIHHPDFRAIAGRAIADSIIAYLNPAAPALPTPPTEIVARNVGNGQVQLLWSGILGSNAYRVQRSSDGFAWDEGQVTAASVVVDAGLAPGTTRFYRVAALNATGASIFSEPVAVRVAPKNRSPLLLVNGFDRRDRRHKEHQNPRDWLTITGTIAAAIEAVGLPFDSASNEAVAAGRVALSAYDTAVWSLGAESTIDETFSSTEQVRVQSFLAGGGKLLVSGAEIGWDLDTRGDTNDRAFLRQDLGVTQVADDAGVYWTAAQTSGLLGSLPAMRFSDANSGRYDVAYPDVFAPTTGSGGQVVLRYSTLSAAGILSGSGQVLTLGFPLEALVSDAHRQLLLARALNVLLELPLELGADPAIGQSLPVALHFPANSSEFYAVAASLAATPAQPLPGGGALPLANDALFALSLDPAFSFIFDGFLGQLDAQGRATPQLHLPNDPALSGFQFLLSGVTANFTTGIVGGVAPYVQVTIP